MPALAPALRNILEKTVIAARDDVEDAARIALQRLAVDEESYYPSMSTEQQALRVTLRARSRQLGDPLARVPGSVGSMPGLVTECAYEHWHRMLFARFLAENGLLMHPEGVAVSLTDARNWRPMRGCPTAGRWPPATRRGCCPRSSAPTTRCSG